MLEEKDKPYLVGTLTKVALYNLSKLLNELFMTTLLIKHSYPERINPQVKKKRLNGKEYSIRMTNMER